MITIGDKQLATRHPADLDAALLASTGCDAAENARFAARGSAFQLARSLAPLLVEPPAGGVGELAAMIEGADLADTRRQVVALLAPEPAPAGVVPQPVPVQPAPVVAPGVTA